MKRFELLPGLPAYGPMYVSISDSVEPDYSEGLVIRFYKEDGTKWVANFKPGWRSLNHIQEFPDHEKLLIIAGGLCYFMHPEESKPISIFGCDYEGKLQLEDGRLVLYNSEYLTIVENDASYWYSQKISQNGLKDVSVQGVVVAGLAFDVTAEKEQWKAFGYHLDTQVLTGGAI